ncbi:MAG: hypothetical protein HUK25_01985, partial [Treponema sp.]|nr:hypothetical protein [Treponema sp.]
EFISGISYRGDIFNSKYFIDFFNLENHYEDINKNEPKLKFKINDLKFEVSELTFIEKEDILIVGCAVDTERNLLSMNTLNKMQFWKKPEDRGEIIFYKLDFKDKNSSDKSYELINKISTISEVSCFCLSEDNNYLLVGYYNGFIDVFELPQDLSQIKDDKILQAKNNIQISSKKSKINNIGFNPISKLIYSTVMKDIGIYVNLIDSEKIGNIIPGSQFDLCGFCYKDKYETLNDFAIYIDMIGKLSIGTINNENKCVNLLYVYSTQLNNITLLNVNWEKNYIFIGDKNGNINVISFELSLENSEKVVKLQLIFTTILTKIIDNTTQKITKMIIGNYPYKIKDICYNPRKKELLIALGNGSIQILTHFKTFAECVLYENKKTVNRIYFSKSKSVVITGGIEKNIIVYELPDNYGSELCRKFTESNKCELLTETKVCENELEKGYSKDTKLFKKKSLIDKLPDPK